MKKIISMLLAATFLLALLVGCSPKPEEGTQQGFVEDIFEETDPPILNTEPQSTTAPTQVQEPTPTTQPTEGQQTPGTTEATTPTQGQQGSEPTDATQPSVTPTQPTEGTEPTQPSVPPTQPTEGTEPTPPATDSAPDATEPNLAAEYEAYLAMNASQKKAFQASFEDYNAFFAWYNAAYQAYQDANPPTPIPPDGNIDLG